MSGNTARIRYHTWPPVLQEALQNFVVRARHKSNTGFGRVKQEAKKFVGHCEVM